MRKKLTGLLAVFACILILTACAGNPAADKEQIDKKTIDNLYSIAESTVQKMDTTVNSGLIEEWKNEKVIYSGLQSWESARQEIGEVDFSVDADGNGIADCFEEKSVTADDDSYTVTIGVTGTLKSADFVVTVNREINDYTLIVTNVNYTDDELMHQALMNTILGMGTTFAVLILLSLIIAAFGRILTFAARKKAEADLKKEEAELKKGTAVSPGGAVSSETSPGMSGDGQLVAVIAAAVAAYRAQTEPAADPGAFVVRRIRRVRGR